MRRLQAAESDSSKIEEVKALIQGTDGKPGLAAADRSPLA